MDKRKMALAATAGPFIAAAAGLATASPASASFVARSDFMEMLVTGSGTHIDEIRVYWKPCSSGFELSCVGNERYGFFEITGPKGIKITSITQWWRVDNHVWAPHSDEPAGTYCGTFWDQYNGVDFRVLDQVCGPVS